MPPANNAPVFAMELAGALPKRDPWPGKGEGDELRVVNRDDARQYVDGLFAKFGLLSVDAVLAYKRKSPDIMQRVDSFDDLLDTWLAGDSAVIVRLRKNRPVQLAFIERITPTRVRWNYLIGALVESGTAYKVFRQLGIRECIAHVSIPAVLARVKDHGFRKCDDGSFALSL